jgi:ABC-2 type transport system ATP-binding protein
VPERERPALITDLLALVDLSHRHDDMVDSLSRGMKQRLCLARTLAHDPQILILDEPASGLDPRARIEIRELLVELSKLGKTVFFSSHILADVAEICTDIGIIEAGEMVTQGNIDEMQRLLIPHRTLYVTLLGRVEETKDLLLNMETVDEFEELPPENGRHRLRISLTGGDEAVSKLLSALVERGLPIVNFTEEERDLEEIFMRATKGIVS